MTMFIFIIPLSNSVVKNWRATTELCYIQSHVIGTAFVYKLTDKRNAAYFLIL